MVGGVVEEAGGGVGEDVEEEEEEATGSLMHETDYNDDLNLENLFLPEEYEEKSLMC